MLRASSKAVGIAADVGAAVGRDRAGEDAGVTAGALLMSYAEAVHSRSGIADATALLIDEIGEQAMAEAAMTCAAFNGLVRVADGIGIQLDEGTEMATRSARPVLGLDSFGGAANTTPSGEPENDGLDVAAMFSRPD